MKFLRLFILTIFVILAGFSLVYMIKKTLDPLGATDFHSYWFSGHFIRQGTDPYTAFVHQQKPAVPVRYLDGKITTSLPIAQPNLARVPANTFPMVEFLTGYAFFSWPFAKLFWLISNLIFITVILKQIVKLFPGITQISLSYQTTFFLIFISLFGTRNIVGNGQTSLLVFAAMLLALKEKERWLFSGLVLGFALSKYSLALPILIVFTIEGKFRQILVAVCVQFCALILLSLITNQTMISIVNAYLKIFQLHTDLPGIHLATLFSSSKILGFIAVSILTIGTSFFLGHWLLKNKSGTVSEQAQQSIFTILMLWTLLVAYHRAYDTFVSILFVALIIEWLASKRKNLSQKQQWILRLLLVITIIILTIPAGGFQIIETKGYLDLWLRLQSNSITILLLSALICSFWVLYQIESFPRNNIIKSENENIH